MYISKVSLVGSDLNEVKKTHSLKLILTPFHSRKIKVKKRKLSSRRQLSIERSHSFLAFLT